MEKNENKNKTGPFLVAFTILQMVISYTFVLLDDTFVDDIVQAFGPVTSNAFLIAVSIYATILLISAVIAWIIVRH
jgi:hypothetical protein